MPHHVVRAGEAVRSPKDAEEKGNEPLICHLAIVGVRSVKWTLWRRS
jgi:hypothetical protein